MFDWRIALIVALLYNLSWFFARRRGFSGAAVLVAWVALAAVWIALSEGPMATLAAALAAAAAWAVRARWFHYFERPGFHCSELGGRLRLSGLGYGAVLSIDAPDAPPVLGDRLAIWIDGLDGDALGIRRLIQIRRLLESAHRVRLGDLRRRAGRLVARVYADGRDVATLLAESEGAAPAEPRAPRPAGRP
jgi:hypothetical protein